MGKERQKRAETQLVLPKGDRYKRVRAVSSIDPLEQTLKEHRVYTVKHKWSSKSETQL